MHGDALFCTIPRDELKPALPVGRKNTNPFNPVTTPGLYIFLSDRVNGLKFTLVWGNALLLEEWGGLPPTSVYTETCKKKTGEIHGK